MTSAAGAINLLSQAAPSEVAESVFDFLHMEMVNYVQQSTPAGASHKDEVVYKLERIGFQTGQATIERCTKDVHRFKDQLDVIKFLCKEFWTLAYGKQIDNLRTNHRGVYVLQDNRFRVFANISNSKQFLENAAPYAAFACGMLRGALANLGIVSVVTADLGQTLPSCLFQVKML